MSLDETISIMTLEPLSASQRPGGIVVAVFALLSTLALVFIAIRLATVVLLENRTSRTADLLFFRSQLGYYAGCLILSNMLISLAGLIDFSWVSRSGLSQGPVCSAQVVLTQVGIWATCWFSSALNVHAVISFVFRIRPARWRNLVAIIVGWMIAFVAGLVPLQKSRLYGPVGPTCGIARSYAKDIFPLAALPIILAAFTSTAIYSVRFFVLRGKLSMDGMQIARGSANQQGEDKFEEHHGFISTISWTMFWFPLAFVLLLLPFCVTRILMFTGNSAPFASLVFADVCIYMLGFVNVCLLCNTLRVIKSMYRGPRSDDTVETFGNDASGESPVVRRSGFFSRSTSPSHENGHRLPNPTQPQLSSNHSRGVSADSNTGLLSSEKASYRPEMVPVALIPAHFSRRVGGGAPLTTPWSTLVFEPGPRISYATRDTVSGPSTEDQRYSFQSAAGYSAHTKSTKGAREPSFRSKAPPSLDLSRLPNPWLSVEVTNKSSTLAARLGIPGSSGGASSRTPVPLTLDQGTANVSVFRAAPVPRIEVDAWSPEHADEFPSPSSPPLTDSDSDYSGQIMYIRKVRPLPGVPEPSDSEQDMGDLFVPSIHARSQRTTMTSVWSQETGYTLSQPPDVEGQGVHNQLVAHIGVTLGEGDRAGAIRRSIPSGPRPPPQSHRPKSSDERHSTIAFAPNDNTT